jgi:hypothetical protein
MIRRCVCMIAAIASFSVNGAPTGASLGNVADQRSRCQKSGSAAASAGRQSALGNSHERPFRHARSADLFGLPATAGDMPVAEAPPPPAAPEQPPLTLVGTAIGKPQNVALILNQTTGTLVRLHVGEEAAGWYLRSVDARTMTLKKDSQQVTLSLPVPSAALPANPQPVPARIAGLKAL